MLDVNPSNVPSISINFVVQITVEGFFHDDEPFRVEHMELVFEVRVRLEHKDCSLMS